MGSFDPLFARKLREKNQTPPHTPTNEDRLREYRMKAPVRMGNGWRWQWHARAGG